jgi:hypothetical protein
MFKLGQRRASGAAAASQVSSQVVVARIKGTFSQLVLFTY